jgi:hypothetical protein
MINGHVLGNRILENEQNDLFDSEYYLMLMKIILQIYSRKRKRRFD